jgi:protein-L-isoaspartate(D-aspartate) O-methyltransferase
MKTVAIIISFFIIIMYFPQVDKYAAVRNKMVDSQIINRGISDVSVIKAMRKVPRHLFVSSQYVEDAYGDYPLPIAHGQTISQPFIVAYMTEIVNPTKNKKALEIGTGSGYQAAILAETTDSVYSIDIIPELASEASTLLRKLGYTNIKVKSGDGYNGWPEYAPFDIIVVTAAAETIPEPLINQLAEGGRLVIPVGKQGGVQELKLVTRKRDKIMIESLIYVRFVPFKRESSSTD